MGRKKHGVNDDIDQLVRRVLLPLESRSDIISPVYIASEVDKIVDPENEAPETKTHGFIMYVRERARKIIAERHDPVKNEPDDSQQSLFKGLQTYYPRASGIDYIKRERMSADDYLYNIDRLRKEAVAKTEHARQLEIEYKEKLLGGIFDEVERWLNEQINI